MTFVSRWQELSPERCQIRREHVEKRRLGSVIELFVVEPFGNFLESTFKVVLRRPLTRYSEEQKVSRLYLKRKSQPEVLIAEAEGKAEQESLAALLDTIRAVAGIPASLATPAAACILRCAHCGSVVTPANAAHVACDYCSTEVQVPAQIRARIEDVERIDQAETRVDKLVSVLLVAPGAQNVSRRLLWAIGVSATVWLTAVVGAVLVKLHGNNSKVGLLSLFAFPIATVVGMLTLTGVSLGSRQALRLLTLEFGAYPPAHASEAFECRMCGGQLPTVAHQVARCLYCGVDNILGFNLRPQRGRIEGTALLLEDALRRQARLRARSLLLVVFAVIVLAFARSRTCRGSNAL